MFKGRGRGEFWRYAGHWLVWMWHCFWRESHSGHAHELGERIGTLQDQYDRTLTKRDRHAAKAVVWRRS